MPFAISEYVDGTTLRTQDDIELLSDDDLAHVVHHLIEALAKLHDVDHVKAGLGTYGRANAYAARQLRR